MPTVLLVDDDRHLLEGLGRTFHREPYRLVLAESATRALAVLAAESVDVVVSDENMPGMCGSEFLARVRAEYPDTVRIMLTGKGSLDVAMRAINGGEVYRFLTKPCESAELAVTLRQALQQRELVRKSGRLLETLRRQSAVMDDLEEEVRGLTDVRRDASGRIVIRDAPTDLDALLREVTAELETAGLRLRERERAIRARGAAALRGRLAGKAS